MAEVKGNLVRDGKGGFISFPPFITQADMDLIEKEFVAKDGDVFVTTFPRSGTTWTEQMVHLLVNNGEQGKQLLTDAVPWLETLPHRPNGMTEFLETLTGRRLFTSHLPYPLMPSLKGTAAKVVYIARNPKDVAISMYFHSQSKLGYAGTWEVFFQQFLKGEIFGSYFDHILPWWHASQTNKNILFLKYEDMKHNHKANVAKIASFLDLEADEKLIDTVVALSSFKSMASGKTTNFDWVPQQEGRPKHYRKGEIGDWRNHFSNQQSQEMDEHFIERMKDSDLQFDFGNGVILP